MRDADLARYLAERKALVDAALDARLPSAQAVGTAGLTGGQHDDLRLSGRRAGVDQGERGHHRKAGSLFVVSVRIPAELLGLDPPEAAALESYAGDVGLAFQIADDLRGTRAVSEDAGKNTFVSHLGEDGARQRLRQLVAEGQEAIAGLGDRADPLRRLTDYVAARGA